MTIGVGSNIGPYRLTRTIGAGGVGTVFAAEHPSGAQAAVKTLAAERAKSPELLKRFFNEAQTLRKLNESGHPGLVQIFDCGQLDDGTAYLVMELLIGETLADRIRRLGRIPEPRAVRIIASLVETLTLTHERGIIHRDLKPGNVMLVPDATARDGERVKLLDFGIAKLTQQEPTEDHLTKTGVLVGTPQYMSPEQCKGTADIDGRADVYSLGVMLFEMLAGRTPFGATTGNMALMMMHLVEDAPPIEQFVPTVSRPLAALLGRMLAKRRDDRPTMAEVSATLRTTARDSATSMPPYTNPSLMQHGVGQVSGRPPRVGLVIALCGVVLIGSGGATAVLLKSRDGDRATKSTTTGKPTKWTIRSWPPGASVTRTSDGVVLGTTPFVTEPPATRGTVAVKLKLSGFRDHELILDTRRNSDLTVELLADPVAAETATTGSQNSQTPSRPVSRPNPIRTNRPPASSRPNAETKLVDN